MHTFAHFCTLLQPTFSSPWQLPAGLLCMRRMSSANSSHCYCSCCYALIPQSNKKSHGFTALRRPQPARPLPPCWNQMTEVHVIAQKLPPSEHTCRNNNIKKKSAVLRAGAEESCVLPRAFTNEADSGASQCLLSAGLSILLMNSSTQAAVPAS